MTWEKQLLSTLSGTGLDYVLLRAHDAVVGSTGETEPDVKNFEANDKPEESVIFPFIPGYRSLGYRYCVLADAFRRRGYKPIILIDDDTLNAPFERTVDQSDAISAQTRYFRQRIPKKFGIEPTKISSILDDSKSLSVTKDDVDIPRYARGSTRKHLKRYSIDTGDESVSEIYQKFKSAGEDLATVVRTLCQRQDIAALIAHEPYYVQGGIPMEVANNFDIPAYSQVWGFRQGHLVFGKAGNRSSLPQYTDESLVSRNLTKALSEDERKQVKRILRKRESGENLNVDYSAHTNKSVEVGEDQNLVAIFTNLLWDATLEPEQAVYGDVFEWLSDTIESLGEQEQTKTVVKTHPAEAKFGTNESVLSWFNKLEKIPSNITVLPPDTDIDTYALLDETDIAVVYNSTVGLEAVCRGIPVIVAGDTHYRGFEFTKDPGSKSEYQSQLKSLGQLQISPETQKRALRYAHLLFVKKHIEFEYCQRENEGGQNFERVTSRDTSPGNEPFDTIVPAFVQGRSIFKPSYDNLTYK